jgi:hypothetical protein
VVSGPAESLGSVMYPVCLNLLTVVDLRPRSFAERFGEVVMGTVPGLFPERAGNFEPINAPVTSPQDFEANWQWPFLAERRAPRAEWGVWFRKGGNRHDWITLTVTDARWHEQDLHGLLRKLVHAFDAAFGMVQAIDDDYHQRAERLGILSFTDKAKRHCFLSVTEHDIRGGLPDGFSVTWLHKDYWDWSALSPTGTMSFEAFPAGCLIHAHSPADRENLRRNCRRIAEPCASPL